MDEEPQIVITPHQLSHGWILYYRGVSVMRRYRIVRKLEDGNYLVLVPNPSQEIDREGVVKFDMANVRT